MAASGAMSTPSFFWLDTGSLTAGGCRAGGTMRAQYHAVPTITANNRSNSYHIRYLPAVLTHLSQPESFYPSQKGGNERHSPTCIILYISSKVLGSARPSRPSPQSFQSRAIWRAPSASACGVGGCILASHRFSDLAYRHTRNPYNK